MVAPSMWSLQSANTTTGWPCSSMLMPVDPAPATVSQPASTAEKAQANATVEADLKTNLFHGGRDDDMGQMSHRPRRHAPSVTELQHPHLPRGRRLRSSDFAAGSVTS